MGAAADAPPAPRTEGAEGPVSTLKADPPEPPAGRFGTVPVLVVVVLETRILPRRI